MTTKIVIKEVTALAENTKVVVAQGINLANFFIRLSDTPNTFVGQNSKFVKVRADGNGLEFTNTANATELGGIAPNRFVYGDNERGTTVWTTGVDDILKTGSYYVTTDYTNLPVAVEGYLSHTQSNSSDDYAEQKYTPYNEHQPWSRTKINGVWTTWEQVIIGVDNHIVMTAAEHDAILAQNEEKYAASGMVHNGKQLVQAGYATINEGLMQVPNLVNAIRMGCSGNPNTQGASKTDYANIHIAGVTTELHKESSATWGMQIDLPPAPDGTVIYDSTGDARGTGKVNLNLLTETDPKYGDIASTEGEAQSRAFEGVTQNGDLRLGNNGYWVDILGRGSLTISGGVATLVSDANISDNRIQGAITLDDNTDYIVELTLGAVSNITSVNVQTDATPSTSVPVSANSAHTATINSSTGATQFWLYANKANSTIPATLAIEGISVRKATEEVVTDRVDMFALEQLDMVIKDDEVFDMVQSQSSTFGDTDVPTVDSVRPDSFFAVYDGQTGIVKGKCVKWSTLTDVQKRKVAAYMKERLWVNEDGDLTFTTIRQRSFAGAGNGDWDNVDSTLGSWLDFDSNTRIKPQGMRDVAPDISDGFPTFASTEYATPEFNDVGSYTAHQSTGVADRGAAYKGRCFFYVLGTVSRLNTGAKAKGVNESGGMAFSDGNKWSSTVDSYATQLDCFKNAHATLSGRDDGRLPQYIYDGGLGGVVDRRLSAYAMSSPEESAKAWEKVKNGTYRGLEKLVHTTFHDNAYIAYYSAKNSSHTYFKTAPSGGGNTVPFYTSGMPSNTPVIAWNPTLGVVLYGKVSSSDGYLVLSPSPSNRSSGAVNDTDAVPPNATAPWYIAEVKDINTSVSGNFAMTDVAGDPTNIMLTDALKNGWQGSWVPVFDIDGPHTLTRKVTEQLSGSIVLYTNNNGSTWSTSTSAIDSVTNARICDTSAGRIYVIPYTAFAKQTKPSTNKPVLNGEAGVGSVMQTAAFLPSRGCLLAESTIGAILTSNGSSGRSASSQLTNINLTDLNLLQEGGGSYQGQLHTPVGLGSPTNNSPAVKALPYQISDNGQCSIGVQANELTYGTPTNVIVVTTNNAGSTNITAGNMYKVRGDVAGSLAGRIFIGDTSSTVPINDSQWIITADNKIRHMTNTVVYGEIVNSESSWADDSTMKITASGSGTFTDRNGNTNLSVSHELALPIGWSHNHARVSTQVEGVDL